MKAEDKVSKFYNSEGWEHDQSGNTVDANKWEDLRECSKSYLHKVRKRFGQYLPRSGNLFLDLGSGPIQYPEYLVYSENFNERHCIDLSNNALKIAKFKAPNIKTYCGSFFDISLPLNTYDCSIAQHVLYHMDKNIQKDAIQKLIDITKPGGTIAIVYGNPNSPFEWPYKFYRTIKKFFGIRTNHDLYHFAYPLSWWKQFDKQADIQIYPWRTLNAFYLKKFIPNNICGTYCLNILFKIENLLPKFIIKRIAQYPTIILKKHDGY